MTAPTDSQLSATAQIADLIAIDPMLFEGVLTFGLAAGLILAAVVVLAMLPWTDQQIQEVDAEARRLARSVATELGPRVAPPRRRPVAAISSARG